MGSRLAENHIDHSPSSNFLTKSFSMKKIVRAISFAAATIVFAVIAFVSWKKRTPENFRDLNKNGKMDVYEDPKQSIEARVRDVLKQMTIEEKAGMMFINGARVNDDGTIQDKPATGMFAFAPNALKLMREKKMNHFNLWAIPSIEALAKWYNSMQKYAQDSTRLGI